jgi:hypothetical protein
MVFQKPVKSNKKTQSKYVKSAEQSDGYKNPGQSIVDFIIMELDGSFKGAISSDRGAVKALREWKGCYESSKVAAVMGTVIGLGGFAGLVASSLPITTPIVVCAGIGGLLSAAWIKVHDGGVTNCQTEIDFLEAHPNILKALTLAESKGLPVDVALSVYQGCLKKFSLNPGITLPQKVIDQVYAEIVNGAVTGYEVSSASAVAFTTGEKLPTHTPEPTAWDDDGDDDDFDDDDDQTLGFVVPGFLKSATAETQSPKPEGVAVQAATPNRGAIAPTADRTAVDDMVNPLRSSYVAAPPRTGKGILTAMALREAKRVYPAMTLFTYTPKQDPKEDWYWIPSDAHYNPDLGNSSTIPAQQLYRMIRAWQKLDGTPAAPILFVIDELSVTLSKFRSVLMSQVDPELFTGDKRSMSDWLLEFIIHEASMRQSVDRFVWILTPLNTVGSSGASKSEFGALKNYTLASRDNRKFADGGSAAFAAPVLSDDHPMLQKHHVIAWSHDTLKWLGVPNVSQASVDKAGGTRPPLNYWQEQITDQDLPPLYDTIARMTVTQNFKTETPGTINFDGTKEPIYDCGKLVTDWVVEKLNRFPDGCSYSWLWGQMSKSMQGKVTRSEFDFILDEAVRYQVFISKEGKLFPIAET